MRACAVALLACLGAALAGSLLAISAAGRAARSERRFGWGSAMRSHERSRLVAVGSRGERLVLGGLLLTGLHPPSSSRRDNSLGAAVPGDSPAATLPFPPDPKDRAPRPGEVPSLYDDGLPCSVGCRPTGARIGWPLLPFHSQHPLRAGLNELRPDSLHVAVDIQAIVGARVYVVQGGVADVLARSGPNARIRVGNYVYWHIDPRVHTGERVRPFETIVGVVSYDYGHLALSELNSQGQYVNPLRPGGTVLLPEADRVRPVIGPPAVARDGDVLVSAYAPQSYIRMTTYLTPVLAPAALAYRLYGPGGVALTPLEWAFRGTHLLPWSERHLIYARGAHAPGYGCFAERVVCVPDWRYRLAGGLAPPLPRGLVFGRYRLTIYAWNWSDRASALDVPVQLGAHGWRTVASA